MVKSRNVKNNDNNFRSVFKAVINFDNLQRKTKSFKKCKRKIRRISHNSIKKEFNKKLKLNENNIINLNKSESKVISSFDKDNNNDINNNNIIKLDVNDSLNDNNLRLNKIYEINNKDNNKNKGFEVLNRFVKLKEQKILFNLNDNFPLVNEFINNANKWQDIVKELYDINVDENLDNYFNNVDLLHYENSKEYYDVSFKYDQIRHQISWEQLSNDFKFKVYKEFYLLNNKYYYDIAVVNKYLFLGINPENPTQAVSAFNLFKNDKIIELYKQNKYISFNKKLFDKFEKDFNNILDKSYYVDTAKKISNFLYKNLNVKELKPAHIYSKETLNYDETYNYPNKNNKFAEILKSYKLLPDDIKYEYKVKSIIYNLENERVINIGQMYKLNYNTDIKYSNYGFELFCNDINRDYNIDNDDFLNEIWDYLQEEDKEKYHSKCKRIQLSYIYITKIQDKIPTVYESKTNELGEKYIYTPLKRNIGGFSFFLKFYRYKVVKLLKNLTDDHKLINYVAILIYKYMLPEDKNAVRDELLFAKNNCFKLKRKNERLEKLFYNLENEKGKATIRFVLQYAIRILDSYKM